MRKKDPTKGMEEFLKGALKLAEKIREHSKKAGYLIERLEKTSDFRTLIEQELDRYSRFKEESEEFAKSIKGFAEDFPQVMGDLREVIAGLILELEATGYIVSRSYPTYHISFNKKKFEFSINDREGRHVEISKGSLKDLEKAENALVKDIAEIIALDFHIEKMLIEIETTIKEEDIIRLCRTVVKDGTRIDELHLLVVWWKETKDRLQGLKKVTYAAIELDEKAFRILKRIEKAEKKARMKEKHLPLIMGWIGVVGELTLNIIPGGGIIQSVATLKRGAKLYQETHAMLKTAD